MDATLLIFHKIWTQRYFSCYFQMQITYKKSNMPRIMCDYSKFNRSPYMIKGTNETLSLKGTVKSSMTEGTEKGKKQGWLLMNWNKLFWHSFQLQVGLRVGKFISDNIRHNWIKWKAGGITDMSEIRIDKGISKSGERHEKGEYFRIILKEHEV